MGDLRTVQKHNEEEREQWNTPIVKNKEQRHIQDKTLQPLESAVKDYQNTLDSPIKELHTNPLKLIKACGVDVILNDLLIVNTVYWECIFIRLYEILSFLDFL